MTGEVYGAWDYIFKAEPAFLASFLSPHQSGNEIGRAVTEAISGRRCAALRLEEIRHAWPRIAYWEARLLPGSGPAPPLIRRIPALLLSGRLCTCSLFPADCEKHKKRGCSRGEAPTPLRERQRGQCLPALIIGGEVDRVLPRFGGPHTVVGKVQSRH